MYYEIKVGSVTNAQRGVKTLKSRGYRATMYRSEHPEKGDGCGYVIKVHSENDKVVKALRSAGVPILGVDKK